MDDEPEVFELFVKGEQARFKFLRTDLALCHIFAALAQTEFDMGDSKGVEQAFSKVQQGYATIARLLPHLKDAAHQSEIEKGLEGLRAALD